MIHFLVKVLSASTVDASQTNESSRCMRSVRSVYAAVTDVAREEASTSAASESLEATVFL